MDVLILGMKLWNVILLFAYIVVPVVMMAAFLCLYLFGGRRMRARLDAWTDKQEQAQAARQQRVADGLEAPTRREAEEMALQAHQAAAKAELAERRQRRKAEGKDTGWRRMLE